MKPSKIFFYFLSVFVLILGIAVIFPRDGIRLSDDLKLRFISPAGLFTRDTSSSIYTDSLIQNITVTDDPESGMINLPLFFQVPEPDINMDSIIRARIDSISNRVYPIEFPVQDSTGLAPFFIVAEKAIQNDRLIRILHYGDSQIENDRMTALLRYRFQKVFGGSGCGMVPAIPLYSGNPVFREKIEGDWIRYTGFGERDSTIEHSCYGMMACYTGVPKPDKDIVPSVEFIFRQGKRASSFSTIRIFLHAYVDSGMIAVHINDTISDTITLVHGGYHMIEYKIDTDVEKVKLAFNLQEGGRVYGISFDPEAGVQMDNIAMRGSSGLEFSNSDRQTLDTMLTAVNPGLIIMQFGGNVVPYIKSASFYKKTFKRELNYLKTVCPGVKIVVIGPGDMSTRENGKFVTFNTLEPVRDALREAALESGCAFWDMYEAMGGENSITNFVLADPPLATSDYIHFTPRGANLVAGMFFDAVMLEYGKYKAGQRNW
ncbi:MAG: GDSL-type esterase/lipase family protein [Bacteroidales bacterium]